MAGSSDGNGICEMRAWFLEQMSKAGTAEDQEQWAELEREHFQNCEQCLRAFHAFDERIRDDEADGQK